MSTNELYYKLFLPIYEGEGDPSAGDTPAGDPPASDPKDPPASDPKDSPKDDKKKTYTQEDLEALLKKERESTQKQTKRALDELNSLRTKAKLTQEERDALDKKLEEMSAALMTKEELAARERDKLKKTHQETVEKLTKEASTWKNRYTDSMIMRAITDAAATNNAFNPKQIVAILRDKTSLTEDVDDSGNPTGEFSPKVKFPDINKDGKPVVLDLSVADAVKRMKEIDEYMNLFKDEGTGGMGSTNRIPAGKTDIKNAAKNTELYRRLRKEGKLDV